jgi:OmpA-OmpF porin, OOP family
MKKRALVLMIAFCSAPALADSPFSAELLLGTADQKSTIKFMGTSESTSGDDISLGVRGVYTMNPNLAFEIAYQNYGQTDDTYIDEFGDTINDKVSSKALNLGVKGMLPLNNGVILYGRAGVAVWDLKFRETDSAFPGEVFTADDSGNDIYYGVGVQYDLNPQLSIGVEYTITEMSASLEGISVDHEVKNLSLSLGFKF